MDCGATSTDCFHCLMKFHMWQCHCHMIGRLICVIVNTLRPRQNGRHFADDTFNSIFVNENVRILITFSLKFVPKGSINNILALVQMMAWRRWGDKPLSEPMMVRLLMHICVTRPQWVKQMQSNPTCDSVTSEISYVMKTMSNNGR